MDLRQFGALSPWPTPEEPALSTDPAEVWSSWCCSGGLVLSFVQSCAPFHIPGSVSTALPVRVVGENPSKPTAGRMWRRVLVHSGGRRIRCFSGTNGAAVVRPCTEPATDQHAMPLIGGPYAAAAARVVGVRISS